MSLWLKLSSALLKWELKKENLSLLPKKRKKGERTQEEAGLQEQSRKKSSSLLYYQLSVLIMINYLIWNIRGVANTTSIRRLKHLIKKHKVAIIAIIEPKSTRVPIVELQAKLRCIGSLSNASGSIWVMWKDHVQCTEVVNEPQQITLNV